MVVTRCGFCRWMGLESDLTNGNSVMACPACGRTAYIGYMNANPFPNEYQNHNLNIHELRQLHGTFTGKPMDYKDGIPYHTFGKVKVDNRELAEPFIGFPSGTPIHVVQEWFATKGMPEAEAYSGF